MYWEQKSQIQKHTSLTHTTFIYHMKNRTEYSANVILWKYFVFVKTNWFKKKAKQNNLKLQLKTPYTNTTILFINGYWKTNMGKMSVPYYYEIIIITH